MMEIFQYEFMRNAFLAALLASVACGIIGTFVVVKRITFISGAIAHAAFGGVGLGYLLGVNPLITVLPFSVAAALGMGLTSKKAGIPEDTSIGIFWAVGMALGVIFIGFTPGYAPDLFSYLFGNILTVPFYDIVFMLLMNLMIIGVTVFFYSEFISISFDEEYATATGVRTRFFYLLLLCLVALTVVVLIRIVGIILVIALLTIPAAVAKQTGCSSMKKMMLLSTAFGMLFTTGGLFLSFYLDISSGATIILVAASGFLLAWLTSSVLKKKTT
jgi:zinc transport system permease protein